MARTQIPRTGMMTALWAAATLFAAALLVPLASAASEDARARPDVRDRPVDARDARDFKPFSLQLSGSGVSKDNVTYSIVIDGKGLAHTKDANGSLVALRGKAFVTVTITNAAGEVVKEAKIRLVLGAKQQDDGTWIWHAESIKKPFGRTKMILHGEATLVEPTALALTGHGRIVYKAPDESRPMGLRFDVAGTLARLNASA